MSVSHHFPNCNFFKSNNTNNTTTLCAATMTTFKSPPPPDPQDNDEDALTEASTVVGCEEDHFHDSIEFRGQKKSSSHQPRPSSSLQRIHWLTVHAGSRMSVAALCKGGVRADGCHSTLYSEGEEGPVMITYIHLTARCRQTQIHQFIARTFGPAVVTRVVEAVSDRSLIETPEFQLLARHVIEENRNLVYDGKVLGLMSKYARCKKVSPLHPLAITTASAAGVTTTTTSSRKQSALLLELENAELRQRIASLERGCLGMEDRLRAAYTEKLRLETEMGALRQALSEANNALCGHESELKRLRIENSEFRRLGAGEKETRRLNRELLTLRDHLDDKARDCKVLEMMLRIAREDNAKLESIAAMAPRLGDFQRLLGQ